MSSTNDTAASDDIDRAVIALRRGGVIAYPTEAVFGFGCDPHNEAALQRLFAIKRRDASQGVLLIAADLDQVLPYIDPACPTEALDRARATWPGPHTWVFPRSNHVPAWIAGNHAGIALRVTAHPVAAALCRAFGAAIVSTSANRHGSPPLRDAQAIREEFGVEVDAVVAGAVDVEAQPSSIRTATTEVWIRR